MLFLSIGWVWIAGFAWGQPYIVYPQSAVGDVKFGHNSCSYAGNEVVCNFQSLKDLNLYVVCVDERKTIEGDASRIEMTSVSLRKGYASFVCGLNDQLVGIFKSANQAFSYMTRYSAYYQQVTE